MEINYVSRLNSEMSEILNFPNIRWRIENAWSITDTRSPTFEFLRQEWRLIFLNATTGDSGIFKFFLRRLISPADKQDMRLKASSYIVQADGRLCMKKTKELDLNLDEWCLVFWDKSVIRRCVGPISELRFFCSIRLVPECESDLVENDDMDINPAKYSPCSYIMCQDFASMFNKHFLSDVTLVCGNETIYAHRAVLFARSKWFAKSFSQLQESQEQSFNIDDVEPTILKQLIRYMYSGEISDLSVANVRKIYIAANNYEVESLKNKCMHMIENLSLNVPAVESAEGNVEPAEGNVESAEGNVESAEGNVESAEGNVESAEGIVESAEGNAESAEGNGVVSEKSDDNSKNDATSYFSDIQAVLCSVEWKNLSENHPEMAQKAFQYFVTSCPCENPESV